MKLNKVFFGAAALCAAGFVSAQTVNLHGTVDYSVDAVKQSFSKAGSADMESSKAVADFCEDNKTVVDLKLTAANFEFNLGVKLNASAGMNSAYWDYTRDVYTPFYQGNMKISFLNDQLKVYTGKFEGFNGGYVPSPALSDDPIVSYFASSGMGQHYTAVECSPYAVKGLKVMLGLPVLPVSGNGVQNNVAANQWKNLYKKINGAVAYKVPGTEIEASAGYRYGTYYTGVKEYKAEEYIKNHFGEAFAAATLNGLVDGLDLNVVGDFRYKTGSYVNTMGKDVEHFTFAAMGSVSAKLGMIEGLPVACEANVFYCNDDYLTSDEKLLGTTVLANTEYTIPGTKWSVGGTVKGKYAVDARGTSAGAGADCFAGFSAGTDAEAPEAGKTTNYITGTLNPYVQYNLANGFIRMGANVQCSTAMNKDSSNLAFSYCIPVGLVFNF